MAIKMATIKEKYRAFKAWQKKPYTVAPMSNKEHDCFTCHTHFRGNFCPRCGQSAHIERYSLKDTTSQFFEVWGVGNRSFFRCLRDLILRPGYMIRDYLSGMQMAYYPPFQLLSTLLVAYVFVEYVADIHGWVQKEVPWQRSAEEVQRHAERAKLLEDDKTIQTAYEQTWSFFDKADEWQYSLDENFPMAFPLLMAMGLTLSIFLFFRKSRRMPKLSFSEAMIASVYCICLMTIYTITMSFFCIETEYDWVIMLLFVIIPIKQLFGAGWIRTLLSVATSVCFTVGIYLIILIVVLLVWVLWHLGS